MELVWLQGKLLAALFAILRVDSGAKQNRLAVSNTSAEVAGDVLKLWWDCLQSGEYLQITADANNR